MRKIHVVGGCSLVVMGLLAVFVVTKGRPMKEMSIQGDIDSGFNYTISVAYVAKGKTENCEDVSSATSSNFGIKRRYYTPTIKAGKHAITFPLNELEPDDLCDYQPVSVSVCTGESTDPKKNNCNELFDITHRPKQRAEDDPLQNYYAHPSRPLKINCKNGAIGWRCWNKTELVGQQLPLGDNDLPLALFRNVEDRYQLDIHFELP